MAELLRPFAGTAADELAARLIGQFGSLAGAMQAPAEAFGRLSPDDVAMLEQLRAAGRLADFAAREQLVRQSVSVRDHEFRAYLRRVLTLHPRERLHVTFTDRADGFIADELVDGGTVSAVELHGRHIVGRALELGAHGLIFAHNHPSGSAMPSPVDVSATRALETVLAAVDIRLTDHLIVTRTTVTSMREGGFL